MSKSLKSATKAKSPNNLFGAEPKGRAAPRATSRATSAEAGYTAGRHRGAGRIGAGTPAPRHVYRRHRRKGAASSVRRSHRQRHGRPGRACLVHRGGIERRRICRRHRQWPAAFRSIRIQSFRRNPRSKSSCARCIPAASSIPRSMRPRAACTASASPWSTRSPRCSRSRSRASRSSTRCRSSAVICKGKLQDLGKINDRRGTRIRFEPDTDIFGAKAAFKPQRLFKMARSKAYLFGGVKIRWRCDPELLRGIEEVPAEDEFHFVGGLKDYLAAAVHADTLVHPDIFSGKSGRNGAHGACEWAVAWTADADGFLSSYCNTVPTPDGGARKSRHAQRHAAWPERPRRAHRPGQARRPHRLEDVMVGAAVMLSVFVCASRNFRARPRPTCYRRSAEDRRTSDQGSVRPLGCPAIRFRPTSSSTSSSAPPTNGCAAAPRRRLHARPR